MLFILSCFLLSMMVTALSVQAKGGAGPFLASCCLGPRIGLEMNEDVDIELLEFSPLLQFIPFVGNAASTVARVYISYDYGYTNAGGKGFLASFCLGPRIGKQLNERKIRTKEYLMVIPIIQLYPWITTGLEAFGGRTMTEIAEEENLNR